MGPQTTRMARLDPGPSASFGTLGAILAIVGAILVVVSFTVLDWFDKQSLNGLSSSHFSDVHRVLNEAGGLAAGTSKLYFAWLGWALVIVVAVLALVANMPSPLATLFRVIGAVAGAAAIGVTFLAIKLASAPAGAPAPAYSDYIKHARLGFYFAVGGFLIMAIGALIGPSRGD